MGKRELITLRVPFSDTDAMGVVHHSKYLTYLEMARIEFLRNSGQSYVDYVEKNLHLPVIEVNIRYRKPLKFDDVFVVKPKPSRSGARIVFDYDIVKEKSGDLVAKARTEHVLVDQSLKMVEPPPELLKILGE